MRIFEVSLIEWPEGLDKGGPRLLGRTQDSEVVDSVREHIAAARRREIARIECPVRLVTGEGSESETGR